MARIEDVYREVIEKSEWLAIATTGSDGPHLAACWTRNILPLDPGADEILIPARHLEKTARNLEQDPQIELLFVARDIKRVKGDGQGLTVLGIGEGFTSGPKAEATKARFRWTRGVLVVKVTGLKTHLP